MTDILPHIESLARQMQTLTADKPSRFEIRHGHLRLITPAELEGHRQGRNFTIYQSMADSVGATVALTDFGGVALRFMELFPDEFEQLREQIKDLSKLMEYQDQGDHWVKIWS